MHNWFKCAVKYTKTADNGLEKKVKEEYLVDALSYTEAESRFIKEMEPLIHSDFSVDKITKYKVDEIFTNGEGDRYYKVTCDFIELNDKSGTEKRKAHNYLVLASSTKGATELFEKNMKGTMVDYALTAIKEEKKLFDIFPYEAAE